MRTSHSETIVILDFETTGISPDYGDRAIEIGAVALSQGKVVDQFQSLMNPGIRVNSFIESYTGITNQMVQDAPSADDVMRDFSHFISDYPLVAHNASFDRRFLDAEFCRIGIDSNYSFACSMLTARRLYPDAPNHKLETLVRYKNLQTDGTFHRALADAEMTAHLWMTMCEDLASGYNVRNASFELMRGLSKTPKAKVGAYLSQHASV